jgi:hypothetical protein
VAAMQTSSPPPSHTGVVATSSQTGTIEYLSRVGGCLNGQLSSNWSPVHPEAPVRYFDFATTNPKIIKKLFRDYGQSVRLQYVREPKAPTSSCYSPPDSNVVVRVSHARSYPAYQS